MKLNKSKCHFLTNGTKEVLFIKVGDELVWESMSEKLLGITVDKKLNFNAYLANTCKKASCKVTALGRITWILSFHKRRLVLKTFESQFSYCPLVWMFCSKKMKKKINHIHERALRLVYKDYRSSYQELLLKDNSLSFHHRNIHCLAIEMYKVRNHLCPPFLQELFSYTENKNKFSRPNVRTVKMGEGSIRNFGPIVWNTMLPERMKDSSNLNIF